MIEKFAPFGLKHEIAKRWTLIDWFKSSQVSNKIDLFSADVEISNLILSEKPGLVGRIGGTEARLFIYFWPIPCFVMIRFISVAISTTNYFL